jgi:hypothetical protein
VLDEGAFRAARFGVNAHLPHAHGRRLRPSTSCSRKHSRSHAATPTNCSAPTSLTRSQRCWRAVAAHDVSALPIRSPGWTRCFVTGRHSPALAPRRRLRVERSDDLSDAPRAPGLPAALRDLRASLADQESVSRSADEFLTCHAGLRDHCDRDARRCRSAPSSKRGRKIGDKR